MKVKFEINTTAKNFDPHELWVLQNAGNMWMALSNMRAELREKWKYCEEQKLDKDELWERFHEILNRYNINGDTII